MSVRFSPFRPPGGQHRTVARNWKDLTCVYQSQVGLGKPETRQWSRRNRSSRTWRPQALFITNTSGTIALKLTCPTSPGENTIVRASAPVSQGRETCTNYRILGT